MGGDKLTELQNEITGLQGDIDRYQQQVADYKAAVEAQDAAQEQTIADLQALVDAPDPASNEELEAVIESIKAARADVRESLPTEEPPVE